MSNTAPGKPHKYVVVVGVLAVDKASPTPEPVSTQLLHDLIDGPAGLEVAEAHKMPRLFPRGGMSVTEATAH